MNIEKNVSKNIFNTVMDVKGKTKDNIKARMVAKPRASFVLKKNA
jgi:hypothetical protein